MAEALSNEAKALIDRPNFAHLATLMADGSPQSVPVWVGREGERLLVCTSEGSLKGRNTRRDPRVALSIVDFHDPYEEIQIRGRVVERRPDPDLKFMDPVSHKYIGKPFPMRSYEGRVALVIEIEKARYTKLPFQHTPPGRLGRMDAAGGRRDQGLPVVEISARRASDFLLLGVTSAELVLLLLLTPTFAIQDWIYVSQHLLVLGVALTRGAPTAQDRSLLTGIAVVVTYAYPYAQVAYLGWVPGEPAWPAGGLVLIVMGACLSLASLLTLGRSFGIRPAVRQLTTTGPYRVVRHPMYLAYLVADVGYNLQEWNAGTVLLVIAGWASLLHRIRAEERVLSADAGWQSYAASVRYRLLPGLW